MDLNLFFPAPPGLPVPVSPPRGDLKAFNRIVGNRDWDEVLQPRADRLVDAGVLWLFGFLDAAHALVQQDRSPEGAYWHALVHRSEGDFDNALYWFNRVGDHPLYAALKVQVRQVVEGRRWEGWQTLVEGPQWNPGRFVDLYERVDFANGHVTEFPWEPYPPERAAKGEPEEFAVFQQIVQVEYNLLMEFVLSRVRS
jgi:hypothetical protein